MFGYSSQFTDKATNEQRQISKQNVAKDDAIKKISDLADQHEKGEIVLRSANIFPMAALAPATK